MFLMDQNPFSPSKQSEGAEERAFLPRGPVDLRSQKQIAGYQSACWTNRTTKCAFRLALNTFSAWEQWKQDVRPTLTYHILI